MPNINKNIIKQAGAAVANATNKAAGVFASTPEPGSIISVIQLVNGGRTIGPDALAHFTESVRNKLLSLIVKMEPIQSGTGEPSPDNIRPISGRTGLTVYVSPTPNVADATTYAVDWTTPAGTVYGGTVDVVTGVLTVDRAKVTLDSGLSESNIIITTYDDYTRVTYSPYNSVGKPSGMFVCDTLSDNGTFAGLYKIWHSAVADTARMFLGLPPTVTTKAEAVAWFAANPTTVVYELSNPLTVQLSTTDIVTLVGDNYIWSDSGDVTITE